MFAWRLVARSLILFDRLAPLRTVAPLEAACVVGWLLAWKARLRCVIVCLNTFARLRGRPGAEPLNRARVCPSSAWFKFCTWKGTRMRFRPHIS